MKALLIVPGLVLVAASCAPTIQTRGNNPTDPSASVSTASYQSPFAGYVGLRPVDPKNWTTVNERMRQLGGPGPHMSADQRPDEP